MISVYGIGNPLMDYIIYSDFDFLRSLNTKSGTMNLIDEDRKKELLGRVGQHRSIPGGSCANTIRGLAWLGQADPIERPLFSGAVGSDSIGGEYITEMSALGIETCVKKCGTETGVSVIIVTPDFERTMFTYLGSCRQYCRENLELASLSESQYLYIAGYMWDTESQKEATIAAIDAAKASSVSFVFDLADPFVVERYREDFLEWIPQKVDILFGNREELSLMLQKHGHPQDDERLIREAGFLAPLVIMKIGAGGCLVNNRQEILRVAGKDVKAVDTIGAGDFFSAGFLFGLLKGQTLDKCALLANVLAAGIVSVEGCSLRNLDQRDILACLKAT